MFAIDAFRQDGRTRQEPRLSNDWPTVTPPGHRDHALRADHARRQALLEIDVLAANALGLALDELQTIYRPIMRQYDAETYYDAGGRIVFAASEGPPGAGLLRKVVKRDSGFTPKKPEGTKEGIALGWVSARALPRGPSRAASSKTPNGWPDRARRWCIVYAFDGHATRGSPWLT